MIYNAIKDIVSLLPGTPAFLPGDKGLQNLLADDLDYTNAGVFLFTPLNYTGIETKTYPLMLGFFKRNEFLDKYENLVATLEEMESLSDQFLFRIQAYKDAQGRKLTNELTEVKRVEVENQYNVNLCGVILTLKLKPFNYSPVCVI